MPRRSRQPKVRLTPEQRKMKRKLRAAARQQGQESLAASGREPAALSPELRDHHEEQFWARTRDILAAAKILNEHRERPYWMSIPSSSGNPPLCGYHPCSMFRRDGRWYYGFLFREHRDRWYAKNKRIARKEPTQ